jgi:chorismate mutase/prephenate dehydratase
MALVMKNSIAFLGPEGTFAHVAGISRFGKNSNLVPKASIKEVFDFVTSNESHLGIVPIENSSGGTISPTVDCLTEGQYDGLKIRESLSLNVRLALMAKKKDSSQIKVIYSHHAPLHHCQAWLDKHYPRVPREDVPSTGFAVKQALKEKGAAAIGNKMAGEIYGLDILDFPIEESIENVTQFLVLGHSELQDTKKDRTTLLVTLPNRPGSLVQFLEPFKNEGIDLSRIISRPVPGKPETYSFLVDLKGAQGEKHVQKALKKVEKNSETFRVVGTYPVRNRYTS